MTGSTDFSYEAEFFDDATRAWADVAQTLADAHNEARAVPSIPKIWSKNGRINDAIGTLNSMSQLIRQNLLNVGSYRVSSVSNTVRSIGNEYLGVEEENIEISRDYP